MSRQQQYRAPVQTQSYKDLHDEYVTCRDRYCKDQDLESYALAVSSFFTKLMEQLPDLRINSQLENNIMNLKSALSMNFRNYRAYKSNKGVNIATTGQADSERFLEQSLTEVEVMEGKLWRFFSEYGQSSNTSSEEEQKPDASSPFVAQNSGAGPIIDKRPDLQVEKEISEINELDKQFTKCQQKACDLLAIIKQLSKRRDDKQYIEKIFEDIVEDLVEGFCSEFGIMIMLFEQRPTGKEIIENFQLVATCEEVRKLEKRIEQKNIDFLYDSLKNIISPSLSKIDIHIDGKKKNLLISFYGGQKI